MTDGSHVAFGWRNYRGEDKVTATGAALVFDLFEQDCGVAYRDLAGDWQREIPLSPTESIGPHAAAMAAMFDENSGTSWDCSTSSSPVVVRIDLGQHETLQGLKIDWGTTYARSYNVHTLEFSGSSGMTEVANVSNGDGGGDYVNLSTAGSFNTGALGSKLVLFFSDFESQPGTTASASSIEEMAIFGKTHELCSNKPQLNCTGTGEHVCRLSCGQQQPDSGSWCR